MVRNDKPCGHPSLFALFLQSPVGGIGKAGRDPAPVGDGMDLPL